MTEILFWIGVGAVAACLVGAHVTYGLDAARVRRDTARFPLFAARDRLIYLAATGDISENDEAFQMVYDVTNAYLDIDRNDSVVTMVLKEARAAERAESDPRFAATYARVNQVLNAKAAELPEFADIEKQVSRAMMRLIRARTPRWQLLVAGLVLLVISPIVVWHFFWRSSTADALPRVATRQRLAMAS